MPRHAPPLLPLIALLWGCQSTEDRCLEAGAARAYAEAQIHCAALLAEEDHPEGALILARAHNHEGDPEAALALVAQAKGGPQAGAMLRLGAKIYGRRGEIEAETEALSRALALDQAAGRQAEVAKDAQALAGLWWRRGRYQKALPLMETAAEAAEAVGDRRLMGFVRLGEGSVRNELGDARGAERAWRAARDLLEDGAPGDRAWAALKLGRLRVEEGRMALARVALEDAQALAKAEGRPDVTRAIALNLAIAAMETGDLDGAARHMAEVDAILAKVPDARFQVTRDIFIGVLRRYQGRLPEAQAALAAAEAGVLQPELGWRAALEVGLTAEAQGDLDEAAAAYARSIGHIEAMRGALTSDDLKGWFLGAKQAPYGALFALHAKAGRPWRALAVQERALARMFIDAFVARATGDGRAAYLKDLLPALGAAPGVKAQGDPEALQAAALAGGTAMGWFPAGDGLWWIYLADGAPTLRRLDVNAEALGRRVDDLLAHLDDAEATARAAEALGAALIPKDVALPPGPLHLVIPGGELARVPFALIRHQGAPLVARHELALIPGLTALAAAEALAARGPETPPVVIGDGRGDLPGAAAELKAVAQRLHVEPLTGAAATVEALRRGARASVLHVATHVEVGPDSGRLILGGGATVDNRQIVSWGLAPTRVVLTGCASGVARGEGLWGSVASAFFAAGSPTAVAALWSVDDEAAGRFARLLYEGEGLEAGAAKAVARAQRRLMAEGAPPRDWAPFVVLGDP